MKKVVPVLTVVLFLNPACRKEKLEGSLEILRGEFQWIGNFIRKCTLCPVDYVSSENADFTANIEFDNSGKITFIIDGENYVTKRFRIKDKKDNGQGGFELRLKVDVPKKKLDINDELKLNIQGDTLYIDKYPSPGYPGSKTSIGNIFVRK